MAAEASRAPSVRERTDVSPEAAAIQALGQFKIDGYSPFYGGPEVAGSLLTEAHGLLKVIEVAFHDSRAVEDRGVESELHTLNPDFISSALAGISSLIAMAKFFQEGAA